MLKILCVGQEWRGSDASGLFNAFSRQGCAVNIINDRTHVSASATGIAGKVAQKLIRPIQLREFNSYLLKSTLMFKPHLVLVFKGPFVFRETVLNWKKMGIPVINYFPDVSMTAHGENIPQCIPHFDYIFTTKSFGVDDLVNNFHYPLDKIHFIPHGFDPLIHRKINESEQSFKCDASFIGTYSPHKDKYLAALKSAIPEIDLRIWGGNWYQSKSDVLRSSIQGIGVHGDLFALAINQSCINIALLSEQVKGASKGDQITSRTFQIPGAGGFMIHQRTNELLQYFKEDEEIVCFGSEKELIDKVNYYGNNESERGRIREKGYHRAQRDHSQDARVKEIISILKVKGII